MTQTNASEVQALHQLLGRHHRLERELVTAFSVDPLPAALIERLAIDVSATARKIDALRAVSA